MEFQRLIEHTVPADTWERGHPLSAIAGRSGMPPEPAGRTADRVPGVAELGRKDPNRVTELGS
jgi:hypothetical protein